MKEIIYIHGYNSSGETGRTLENMLKGKIKVHHFQIPVNADEAFKKINNYLDEHPNISLVLGTSLGGFLTSRINGYLKLMINPCMLPSVELPKLGCDTELSNTYIKYENDISFLDTEERLSTFLMFGTDDELIDYSGMCKMIYNKKHISEIPGGHHRVSNEELKKYVIPQIEYMLNVYSPKLYEHFNNI
jgi:predicted esterase YcpF (UPF0227 family)